MPEPEPKVHMHPFRSQAADVEDSADSEPPPQHLQPVLI
jgi:hypothetical protein